jgi:DNA-directed RNA polymerase subunit RPC12/RpoP
MDEKTSRGKGTTNRFFLPTCLNCGSTMEKIEDWGLAMQGGSCRCPRCGEQHDVLIVGGVLTLRRMSVPRGYAGPVERQFRHHM